MHVVRKVKSLIKVKGRHHKNNGGPIWPGGPGGIEAGSRESSFCFKVFLKLH
jgi:hypothetical protein